MVGEDNSPESDWVRVYYGFPLPGDESDECGYSEAGVDNDRMSERVFEPKPTPDRPMVTRSGRTVRPRSDLDMYYYK